MAPLDSSKSSVRPPRTGRTRRPSFEEQGAAPSRDFEDEGLAGVPPILAATPTMGALFAALGRRWFLALFVTLLGGAMMAATLCYFVPGKYVSEARLLLRRPPEYMSSGNESTFDDYVRSQAMLIKSGRVAGET